MLIELSRLVPDRTPVRHTIDLAADAELQRSLAEAGQLEPVLVVPIDGGLFEVKNGNRRLRLAAAAGLTALEVHPLAKTDDAFTTAAAAASNMVRAALAPADQWRALAAMQAQGHTLASAAAFLGLSDRQAARLDRLGRLDPAVLSLVDLSGQMPSEVQLRTITAAPPDMQRRAVKTKGLVITSHGKTTVDWHDIAGLCIRQTYQRAEAIFDADKVKLAWDHDFFVPEGHPDEWTTADTKGFLAAQRKALDTLAAASKGRMVVVEESPRHPGEPALPTGWRLNYGGNPDKPKRGETVYACIASRTGAVVRLTAVDEAAAREAEKAAQKKANAAAKAKPTPSPGENARAIGRAVAEPPAVDDTPERDDGRHGDEDDASTPAGRDQAASIPVAKSPLTKAGQTLLAKAKTEGLRASFRATPPAPSYTDLVAMLILALHAKNVTIQGYEAPDGADSYAVSNRSGTDLVRRLITPDGHLQYDETELPMLALETLARTLFFSGPDAGWQREGSGPTAEWIGAALDAQAHLPRLDTAELLAACDATELRAASKIAEQKFTTATAAKRDLPGKLENWRPTFAHYGAPGPTPAAKGQEA